MLTTDLGGERRFAAAVARRLQSLGALTKGDRRAATGADLAEFNFDTQYGRNALRTMYHHICQVCDIYSFCNVRLLIKKLNADFHKYIGIQIKELGVKLYLVRKSF